MDGRTILAARAGCPRIVPVLSSLAARIAEAKRRPREAKHAPVRRLVVRGVVPLSLDRGRRPPEAENRARQIRGKLVWHRTAALGFGRLRRPRRPRPRGESVGSAKHTPTARRTHLRPRPAPDGTSKGNFWEKQGTNQSGAGVGSQRELVGETERTTPTPPRPRATAIQPPSWDEHRTRSWARGSGIVEPL